MHAGMQRNKGHVVPSMGTCSYMQHLKVKILTGSTCWKLSYEGRRPFWRSPGFEAVQRYLSCGNGASTALFLIYCPIFSLYFLHPSQLLNVFNYFVTLSETFIAWVQPLGFIIAESTCILSSIPSAKQLRMKTPLQQEFYLPSLKCCEDYCSL